MQKSVNLWKPDYVLHIDEIDKQHRRFFEICAELGLLCDKGGTCLNMKRVIKAIVDMRTYAFLHFHTEEVLMARHGYPEMMSHLTQHDKYLSAIKTFREELKECSAEDPEAFGALAKKIAEYAADWWGQHILTVDALYATFIKEQKAG